MLAITQTEIDLVLIKYPAAMPGINEAAHQQWARWRVICDRITANRHYRFEDPQKHALLKMARFAQDMMGHYNYLTYK